MTALKQRAGTLWETYVTSVVRRAGDEAADYRRRTPPDRQRRRVIAVAVASAVSLIAIQLAKHGSDPEWLTTLLSAVGADGLANSIEDAMLRSDNYRFNQLLWWSAVQIGRPGGPRWSAPQRRPIEIECSWVLL